MTIASVGSSFGGDPGPPKERALDSSQLAKDYVHLHVHSDYSLLDGAVKVSALVEQAARFGMKALALTDHGNMCGAIEFYTACQKNGIKPLVGMEAYITIDGRYNERKPGYNHLTLIAQNPTGYKNLSRLSSLSHTEGFYYRPRIDKEILAEWNEGIICLSGCLKGPVSQKLIHRKDDDARAIASWYKDVFGDRFYLEVQPNSLEEQAIVNDGEIRMSKDLDIPLVASCDSHYLERKDAEAQEIKIAIASGKVLSDPNRLAFKLDEFYFKSGADVCREFKDLPHAIRASSDIADRCEPSIPELEGNESAFYLPNFITPDGSDNVTYFERLCREGCKRRYGDTPGDGVIERLEYEIDVIKTMKDGAFVNYFLVTADFINWGKARGIPIGPGRGSAAGSIVAYCMGITDLDPLPFDLLFERFLNPGRVSMPDIDIDFCERRREVVINYVREKYGHECVAKIITFGQMKAKAAVRDVGRVMEVPLHEVDKIAKAIPAGPGVNLRDALQSQPALQDEVKKNPRNKELVEKALTIEGLYRNASTHAAGIVIADRPLIERVPLYRHSSTNDISTQYTMNYVEAIGLLKMDFLGLRTLTVIDDALGLIERGGDKVTLDDIKLDDYDDPRVQKTFQLLAKGETLGVFQLDSAGFRDVLVKMKPDRFTDIIALLALYRPGPMAYIPNFINRKHGRETVEYPHPELETILSETFGVFVYQEQVMRCAQRLAGFSLPEADNLRKAMGKKKLEAMVAYKAKFVEGAVERNCEKATAEHIWAIMEEFAAYAFNKSHSAAYGLVTYWTAWLKANYTSEFIAALLTSEASNTDKLLEYLAECDRMRLEVKPPDVNESEASFSVVRKYTKETGGAIRFGLGAIKGLGSKAVESILAARDKPAATDGDGDDEAKADEATGPAPKGRFRSLWQFAEDVDAAQVNKSAVEALIKAGAFDSTLPERGHRAQLAAVVDSALATGKRLQEDRKSGQTLLFGGGPSPSAGGGAADDADAPLPDVPELTEIERLAGEKAALGFYVSGHPLDAWRQWLMTFATCSTRRLVDRMAGEIVTIGGVLSSVKVAMDKRGNPFARLVVEDLHGSTEAVVFSRTYSDARQLLQAEAKVFITGKLDQRGDRDEGEQVRCSIVVDEVMTFDEAPRRLPVGVKLRVAVESVTEESVSELRTILSRHGGDSPVEIIFERRDGARQRCRSSHLRVKAFSPLPPAAGVSKQSNMPDSPMKDEVEQLIGADRVTFKALAKTGGSRGGGGGGQRRWQKRD